jgi:hypothetical protein
VAINALPGETNQLTVTMAGDMMVVRDLAGLQASPPCITDDARTVRCPLGEGLQMTVFLGDGDDTFAMPRTAATLSVYGEDGKDTITAEGNLSRGGDLAHLYGGPGDDRLFGEWVEGGPGNDVLKADLTFDYSDHTTGVDVDLARGQATSMGEIDQLQLTRWEGWYVRVIGGSGPDVIRSAPGRRLSVESGAGDDVIEGGVDDDVLSGGAGNDVLRGGPGYDDLDGDDGDDRLDGGPYRDDLRGGAGDDVLIGGSGRDTLSGDSGADRVLARDGQRDAVGCAGRQMAPGDEATVDAEDLVEACFGVRRSGRPRLELHALLKTGQRARVLVASCPRAAQRRVCAGRLRIGRGRTAVTRAVRVAPGRRARIRLTLPKHEIRRFRLVLETGEVRNGFLSEVDP